MNEKKYYKRRVIPQYRVGGVGPEALHQPHTAGHTGQGGGKAGDWAYPVLEVLAAFLALAAAPPLLKMGWGQWQDYQTARARLAQELADLLHVSPAAVARASIPLLLGS